VAPAKVASAAAAPVAQKVAVAPKPAASKAKPKEAKALVKKLPEKAPDAPQAPKPEAPKLVAKVIPKAAVPVETQSPVEACGRRIFLAMALCKIDKCKEPEFTNHPQCVQLRADEKARAERDAIFQRSR
jgi:hypothetical protein